MFSKLNTCFYSIEKIFRPGFGNFIIALKFKNLYLRYGFPRIVAVSPDTKVYILAHKLSHNSQFILNIAYIQLPKNDPISTAFSHRILNIIRN